MVVVVNVAMRAPIHISSRINSVVTGEKYSAAVIFNAKTVRLYVVIHDRYDAEHWSKTSTAIAYRYSIMLPDNGELDLRENQDVRCRDQVCCSKFLGIWFSNPCLFMVSGCIALLNVEMKLGRNSTQRCNRHAPNKIILLWNHCEHLIGMVLMVDV